MRKRPSWFVIVVMLGLACYLVGGCIAIGADVTLACNSLTNVLGYRFYWGGASKAYTNVLNSAGPTATASNLVAGNYFFAVTALNDKGESDYSAEITSTISKSTYLVFRLENSLSITGKFKALTNVAAFTIPKPTNGVGFYRVAMTETNQ